jgi:hypothetical protein
MVSLIGLWKPVEKIFNIIDKILFGLSILFRQLLIGMLLKIHTQNQDYCGEYQFLCFDGSGKNCHV